MFFAPSKMFVIKKVLHPKPNIMGGVAVTSFCQIPAIGNQGMQKRL
jgi:hypothetical protein